MENEIFLAYESCVNVNGKLWFVSYDHNGLYCKDKDGTIEFVGRIPGEDKYRLRLFSKILKVDDRLVLVPFCAQNIAIYDTRTSEFCSAKLKNMFTFEAKSQNMDAKFWCAYVQEERRKVVFFPHNYPAMVVLDMEDFSIEYKCNIVEELDILNVTGEPYVTDFVIEGGYIWASCGCAPIIIKVNPLSLECEKIQIPTQINGFNGIYKKEKNVWIAPRSKGGIVRYDIVSDKLEVYDDYPSDFVGDYCPFHSIELYNDRLLLVTNLCNQMVALNCETGEMENIKNISALIDVKRKTHAYGTDNILWYEVRGSEFNFISGRTYIEYHVNLETSEVECVLNSCYGSEVDLDEIMVAVSAGKGSLLFMEDERATLDKFIKLLCERECGNDISAN